MMKKVKTSIKAKTNLQEVSFEQLENTKTMVSGAGVNRERNTEFVNRERNTNIPTVGGV